MGTIITDLKEAFRRGNIYIQLIYINVAVFVVTTLTEVILQLFNRSLGGVFEWLELPASLTQFIITPFPNLDHSLNAVHLRHHNVHQHQMYLFRLHHMHGFFTVKSLQKMIIGVI